MSIIRGAPSIGFSNSVLAPETLPPELLTSAYDSSKQIEYLIGLVGNMQTVLEGKADANKLKTIIQYSDEAIRIQAEQIALVGNVTFLDVWRDQTGAATGVVHPSITMIRGGVIQTGIIKGNSYGPSAGIAIDLDNDIIIAGGSTLPKLYYAAGNLTISGVLTAGSIIAGSVTVSGVPGTPSLADIAAGSSGGITYTDLDAYLATGVGNVIAGAGDDYIMETASNFAVFRHKDAVPFTSIGPYSGDYRTALGIGANGVAMGRHNKTTGAWENVVSIDVTTGAATFAGALSAATGSFVGTVSAGAIIAGTVTVGGVTLSTIAAEATDGAYIRDKLETNSSLILTGQIQPADTGGIKIGTITWNATTGALTGGSGIAITEAGLLGAKAGVATFTISASTGDATFAGTLSAGAVIVSGVTLSGVSGTPTIGTVANAAIAALPAASFSTTLNSTIATGVQNVVAGLTGNYRLEVVGTGIVIRHVNCVPFGNIGANPGPVASAIAISGSGIAMGYNSLAGPWVSSIAIEPDGDVTILGTLTAGSVITGSVTVSGVALSTILADSIAGKAIQQDLEANGSIILTGQIEVQNTGGIKTGTLVWNTTTGALVSGTGVAITEFGIIGAASGVATFTINALTGAATFAGALSGATGTFSGALSGATGSFTGTLDVAGQAKFTGATTLLGYNASIHVVPSTDHTCGLYLYSDDSSVHMVLSETFSPAKAALYGENLCTTSGYGVWGMGQTAGVYGYALTDTGVGVLAQSPGTGAALVAQNTNVGPAIQALGKVTINTTANSVITLDILATGISSYGINATCSGLGGIGIRGYTINGVAMRADSTGAGSALIANNSSSGYALEIHGKLYKANTAGSLLYVYDATTNALIASYRYAFS